MAAAQALNPSPGWAEALLCLSCSTDCSGVQFDLMGLPLHMVITCFNTFISVKSKGMMEFVLFSIFLCHLVSADLALRCHCQTGEH